MRQETKNQLINKNLRYEYDVSNNLYTIPVPVIIWKETQLAFECPMCFDRWKLNNTPYKSGHNILHFHGLCKKDSDGNYGTRSPHCQAQAKLYWGLDEINYEFKLIGANMIY